MESTDILKKYYRVPGISIKLPSMGHFQPNDNVRFTATGEVQVYPMRAADEMLLKSPDALMSGKALEEIVKSCAPDVKEPLELPTPDFDALLLAIRYSTYGRTMDVEAVCPSCEAENVYGFDLEGLLSEIKPLDESYSVRLDDNVVVYVRPFNFRSSTIISNNVFMETRKLHLLERNNVSEEERSFQINESFKRLNHINIQMVADSVEKVVVPEGEVTDKKAIIEFVQNVPKAFVTKIENKLKEINESGVQKRHSVTCTKCNHEWETVIEFDPASFFVQSSS